jgi:hypothetical protein
MSLTWQLILNLFQLNVIFGPFMLQFKVCNSLFNSNGTHLESFFHSTPLVVYFIYFKVDSSLKLNYLGFGFILLKYVSTN